MNFRMSVGKGKTTRAIVVTGREIDDLRRDGVNGIARGKSNNSEACQNDTRFHFAEHPESVAPGQ